MSVRFSYLFFGQFSLLAMFSFLAPSAFGQDSLAEREANEREASVQEGQMLLLKGDEAYGAQNYEEAVIAYGGAVSSFPKVPATMELRKGAAQRYAQAAVELGKVKMRKGDMDGAKAVVDKALAEDMAPNDLAAKAFRAELDDPVRYNPALDTKHAANVDEVRRTLYMAEGSYNLGKYDEAKASYNKVLRIDPYNSAARRGLERVTKQQGAYLDSSRDSARAEILGQVDAAWELPLSPELLIPDEALLERASTIRDFSSVSSKLTSIMIPEFRLEDATIIEALDLIRLRAEQNDASAIDSLQKGINVFVNLGDPDTSPAKEILAKTFDLSLNNVPLEQVLNYIAEITGTAVKKDDFAVTFVLSGSAASELVTRTYRVPPDFLSSLSAGVSNTEEPEDVFNTEVGSSGVLAERMGAQEALELQGISFPEGASASLNRPTNILRVVNSRPNQDIIEQIIDSIALTEPVSVAVRVTMLKVQKNHLEELGYDWMLNNFELGGASGSSGARELNVTGGTTGNGSSLADIPAAVTGGAATNPITAGNRSGDFAVGGDTIDTLIAEGSTRSAQATNRAPGVIGLNGVVGGATIQSLMRGLSQKKGADMLAQPSVTTRSGQAASIFLVEEFIYPTEYEPPAVPVLVEFGGETTPAVPATPMDFDKRDVGVTMEILPVADANKQYVDITINTSITEFEGFVNFGSSIDAAVSGLFAGQVNKVTDNSILMPIFSPNRVNSNLVVADGATIVIGGLQKDEIKTVSDKTPILGDIPVVGRLFQSDVNSHTSTAILFLINVEILDPTGRPYRNR